MYASIYFYKQDDRTFERLGEGRARFYVLRVGTLNIAASGFGDEQVALWRQFALTILQGLVNESVDDLLPKEESCAPSVP